MLGLSVNLLLTIMGLIPIINEDQMPLHRNESSTQKTLNFVDMDAYVKENYNLSRERVTVFTQVSISSDINLNPEFVFKGKGTRTKLDPPDGIKFNWAPKGSYRLDQMLKTVLNLPNKFNIFKLCCICFGRSVCTSCQRLRGIFKEKICSHHYWWWRNRGYTNLRYRYSSNVKRKVSST